MKINGSPMDFFQSIPDDLMAEIAVNDWESLERLCVSITLDYQQMVEHFENKNPNKKGKPNLAS